MSQAMADIPEGPQPAPRRRPFREVVLASGLVTAAELDAAEVVARERLAGSPATPEQFDKAVAKALVERGTLTPFQARELLAGRTRFRLGQYTVIDEIGRGGMGQVFKAEHALMGRHVAVKVLPRAKATPESEAAFRREMRILGRLDHENVVRAFDAGYDAQVYYLVTEFVPGVDLRRHVRKHGPLDEVSAASVFTQVARALDFAHAQGLVHRDVKPGNILVMDDGRVKLLDLGLAGSTLETEALQLGKKVVGTMDYIAPEQIRSVDDAGPPADIYALGCSMYFALTGEVPFPGGSRNEKMRRHLTETAEPLHRRAPHLSQQLCHVVEAMMAKSVADRIGSAAEVIQRLSRWTPDQPVLLPRSSLAAAPPSAQGDSQTLSDSWIEADSSASAGSASGDLTWQRRPESVLGEPADRSLPGSPLDDDTVAQAVKMALQILLPAVAVAIVVVIVIRVVRLVLRDDFFHFLDAPVPVVVGWLAFVVIVGFNAAALLRGRDR